MGQKAEFTLDILIKKEENHFLAHCLQFNITTTGNTLDGVKKDILDLCRVHNIEYTLSPAPIGVFVEYWMVPDHYHI